MKDMTPRERSVFEYIKNSLSDNGYAPSVRDIRDALGFKSTSTVHMYLTRLAERGLITRDGGKSRAMHMDGIGSSNQVPLVGRVTAGKPILAQEDLEGYISFCASSVGCRPENLFALNVKGESMIDAGILDGDVVIVDKRTYAENGEIVVALIEDEATVKTFYKEDGHYRLQPENKTMEPIISESVAILGKVVASLRLY
ncbi:MAG: transcriptional repressor LexA [Clostridia bacterium]|nr:transcriptional repressor LexA [Clostridia bacterium]